MGLSCDPCIFQQKFCLTPQCIHLHSPLYHTSIIYHPIFYQMVSLSLGLTRMCSYVKYPVFDLKQSFCVKIPNKTGIKVKKLKSVKISVHPQANVNMNA